MLLTCEESVKFRWQQQLHNVKKILEIHRQCSMVLLARSFVCLVVFFPSYLLVFVMCMCGSFRLTWTDKWLLEHIQANEYTNVNILISQIFRIFSIEMPAAYWWWCPNWCWKRISFTLFKVKRKCDNKLCDNLPANETDRHSIVVSIHIQSVCCIHHHSFLYLLSCFAFCLSFCVCFLKHTYMKTTSLRLVSLHPFSLSLGFAFASVFLCLHNLYCQICLHFSLVFLFFFSMNFCLFSIQSIYPCKLKRFPTFCHIENVENIIIDPVN